MNNEDEVIEILDDFEDTTITGSPINKIVGLNNSNVVENQIQTPINNFEVNSQNETNDNHETYKEVAKLEEVKYSPIEPEKQEIKIETETEENSKSGIGFVIVLFILLAAVILALPYISKLF